MLIVFHWKVNYFSDILLVMRWKDTGFLVSIKKFQEKSLILHFLTKEHGLHAGIVNDANYKRARIMYQTGNLLELTWSARLEEHLGMYKCDIVKSYSSKFLMDNINLSILNSGASILKLLLEEREPHLNIYNNLKNMFEKLEFNENPIIEYIKFECSLLKELGYGMDLLNCAATGQNDELHYISPKTGKAVSKQAGLPFDDKLFKMPKILYDIEDNSIKGSYKKEDFQEALKILEYFINKHIITHKNVTVPYARVRLINIL